PAAPSDTYPLSLHDALPICRVLGDTDAARARTQGVEIGRWIVVVVDVDDHGPLSLRAAWQHLNADSRSPCSGLRRTFARIPPVIDRKSTRLNSSHLVISYAV